MNNYIINLDCLKITNNVNLDKFKNKSVLVLGANGLLGSYLIAVLNFANKYYNVRICEFHEILENLENP